MHFPSIFTGTSQDPAATVTKASDDNFCCRLVWCLKMRPAQLLGFSGLYQLCILAIWYQRNTANYRTQQLTSSYVSYVRLLLLPHNPGCFSCSVWFGENAALDSSGWFKTTNSSSLLFAKRRFLIHVQTNVIPSWGRKKQYNSLDEAHFICRVKVKLSKRYIIWLAIQYLLKLMSFHDCNQNGLMLGRKK